MFTRALKAVESLSNHIKNNPDTFSVVLQTIISKANYRELPALLKLAIENGFSALATSYLEDAYRHPEVQMTVPDIREFQEEVIPQMRAIVETVPLTLKARNRNIMTLKTYFSPELNTLENWARGIYRPTGYSDCGQPQKFLLLYPGGSAAPCYGFEYIRAQEFMDSTLTKTTGEVINGSKFKNFAETSFDFCHYCPVGLHQWLDLSMNKS